NSMTEGSFEVSDDSQYGFHVGNLRLEETALIHIRISSNDTLLLDLNFQQISEGVHIDYLLKFSMQEGICHVKLMERPSFICSYREENSNCVNLGYRIHLSIVSFLLNASISVFIASLQTLDSKACLTKVGISSKYREVVKIWASGDKSPLAMFAIEYLDLRASFSEVYLFRGTPLLVLGRSSYLTEELSHVPIWVKFHDVPLVAYTSDGLSLMATEIDNRMMLDSYTNSMYLEAWGRAAGAEQMLAMTLAFDDGFVLVKYLKIDMTEKMKVWFLREVASEDCFVEDLRDQWSQVRLIWRNGEDVVEARVETHERQLVDLNGVLLVCLRLDDD
nr:hypothetical protein [Tanacetum cinerariifolium]